MKSTLSSLFECKRKVCRLVKSKEGVNRNSEVYKVKETEVVTEEKKKLVYPSMLGHKAWSASPWMFGWETTYLISFPFFTITVPFLLLGMKSDKTEEKSEDFWRIYKPTYFSQQEPAIWGGICLSSENVLPSYNFHSMWGLCMCLCFFFPQKPSCLQG